MASVEAARMRANMDNFNVQRQGMTQDRNLENASWGFALSLPLWKSSATVCVCVCVAAHLFVCVYICVCT